MNKDKFLTTRSQGFSLIELLVVVAILGVLASVGVFAYSGYVKSAKIKSVENLMQQISLAQSEYKADYDDYVYTGCPAKEATSLKIEKDLLGNEKDEREIIKDDIGYHFCIINSSDYYQIQALEQNNDKPCQITLNGKTLGITKGSNC